MINQKDVNHAHDDRINKMAQFEELSRELQNYAYCLGYNRCMDINDDLRAENTILREALRKLTAVIQAAGCADYVRSIATEALQRAGGEE